MKGGSNALFVTGLRQQIAGDSVQW
jgi:hypothetical protein